MAASIAGRGPPSPVESTAGRWQRPSTPAESTAGRRKQPSKLRRLGRPAAALSSPSGIDGRRWPSPPLAESTAGGGPPPPSDASESFSSASASASGPDAASPAAAASASLPSWPREAHFFVRATDSKTIAIHAGWDETVTAVLDHLGACGYGRDLQLLYAGRQLVPEATLAELRLPQDCTLHLAVRLGSTSTRTRRCREFAPARAWLLQGRGCCCRDIHTWLIPDFQI